MKKIAFFLLVAIGFCLCSEEPKAILFTTLKQTEFDAKPFQLPGRKPPDSVQRAHDSCMGFAFDANAMLIQNRDSFHIGVVVNRQLLTPVNTLNDLWLTRQQMAANFNVISNPCYEKRIVHLPLKTLLGDTFHLVLPGGNEALTREINDAINASKEADMQTGSWVYLDIKYVLQNILDTTQSEAGLQYKNNLLDTANMVMTAVESVTDVSFLIHTPSNLSQPLLAFLQTKPSVVNPQSQVSLQLFFIDDRQFEMTLNGFFRWWGS